MKVSVLVLLSCVVGSLAIAVREIDRGAVKRMSKNSTSASSRQSSSTTTLITVLDGNPESKLFGNCKKGGNTALATFRELQFPSGALYSYYVPSDAQLASSGIVWVTQSDIDSFKECAAFANQYEEFMFKYENGECFLSDTRLTRTSPKCGDQTGNGVFVTSSCTVPTESDLTLTPSEEAIVVTWRPQDSCSLFSKYRLEAYLDDVIIDRKWPVKNKDYIISSLDGCDVITLKAIPLDSDNQELPYIVTKTAAALPGMSYIRSVNIYATGLVTFETDWDVYDPCNEIKSFEISYAWDGGQKETTVIGGEERSTEAILNGCDNLSVTITPVTEAGPLTGGSATVTHDDVSLESCVGSFTKLCSGCLKTSSTSRSQGDSDNYCLEKYSLANLLTVASAEELDAMRTYLYSTSFLDDDEEYWVDIKKISGQWIWGKTNYLQPEPALDDWKAGEPDDEVCAYFDAPTYLLGDRSCDSTSIKPLCYYLPDYDG